MENIIDFQKLMNDIASFFPKDLEIRLILITASLVIVYGISCLFEKDDNIKTKDV